MLMSYSKEMTMNSLPNSLTGVLIAIAATAAFANEPVKVSPPQQKVLSSPNGRYVFGQISDFRRDQYMLDTQTGRLWQIVLRKAKNPDGSDAPGDGFQVLDVVPYTDIDGKLNVAPK